MKRVGTYSSRQKGAFTPTLLSYIRENKEFIHSYYFAKVTLTPPLAYNRHLRCGLYGIMIQCRWHLSTHMCPMSEQVLSSSIRYRHNKNLNIRCYRIFRFSLYRYLIKSSVISDAVTLVFWSHTSWTGITNCITCCVQCKCFEVQVFAQTPKLT